MQATIKPLSRSMEWIENTRAVGALDAQYNFKLILEDVCYVPERRHADDDQTNCEYGLCFCTSQSLVNSVFFS